MAERNQQYNYKITKVLQDLREEVGLTIKQMADYFRLKRDTVRDWELGHRSPHETRRPDFIVYLWDKLHLRRNKDQYIQVWNKVMVEEWGWQPLRRDELWNYNLLDKTEASPAVRPTFPLFRAPVRPPYPLIGRNDQLDNLKQKLFEGERLALYGLPGAGKTALAIALSHDPDIRRHFRDGILWARLGRTPDVIGELSKWGAALGIVPNAISDPSAIQSWVDAIQMAIGMRHLLLVLDDVWQIEAAQSFEAGGPNCTYLATTRIPGIASGFANGGAVEVHELDQASGVKLLNQRLPKLLKITSGEAQALVQSVDGLPLGLILMSTYLQKHRSRKALEQIHQTEKRLQLEESQSPAHPHPSLPLSTPISLKAIIAISDEALTESSRYTLRSLSIFPAKPNTFSEEAALAVSTEPAETVSTLCDVGLLEISELGRYMVHQTIADYGHLQLTDERIPDRMIEFFLHFVESHKMDYGKLDLEKNNIIAALQLAFDREMHTALVRGTNTFYHYLNTRGLYKLANIHLHRAQEAARALGDSAGLATTLLYLGIMADRLGDFAAEQEYLVESLTLAQRSNNQPIACEALMHLGEITFKTGDLIQAEKYWLSGLTIAQTMKSSEHISKLLNNLGIFAESRGDYAKAEENYTESLAAVNETKNLQLIAPPLQNLGILALNRGEYTKAKALFLESLGIAHEIGNRKSIFHVLSSLGAVEFYLGDYIQAEDYWQQALKIANETGDRISSIAVLGNLGALEGKRGNFSQAEKYLLVDGLPLAQKSGFQEYLCYLLDSIGADMIEQKNFAKANGYLLEGLAIAREIKHSELICSLLGALGAAALNLSDYTQAEKYLSESLATARQLGHPLYIAGGLKGWGEFCLKLQKLEAASEAFLEALQILREKGIKELIANILYGLAQVAHARSNIIEACRLSKESLLIFEAIGHHEAVNVRDWMNALSCEHDNG